MCRFGMDFIYPAPSLCDRMVENENMLSQNKFSKASDDNWIYLNLCSPIHYSGNASRCTMGLLELHNTSYADRRGSNINGLKIYRRRLWQHWEGIYNHGGLYDICTFFYYCVSHVVYINYGDTRNSSYIEALMIWEVMCQMQVSRAGPSNYIPQIPWDVISYPCYWCLLLAHHSS